MKKKRLLVIDDDPLVCQTLGHMAEYTGFEVITTGTNVEFFAQLVLFEPNVIVVDLNMPGQDGVQLIRQLAELNHNAQLVIVSGMEKRVLTAAAQAASELGLRVLGILQKPVPLARLQQLLVLYLNASQKKHSKNTSWENQIDNADWMPAQEDLIHVIENDLLTLHYQPKLDCGTGGLIGFEALARWDVPGKGTVTPDVFVPLAESNHLISLMTLNIARQGIRWLSQIQATPALVDCRQYPGFEQQALTLSLNVTAKCMEDSDLPEQLEELCTEFKVDPACIILEISESSAMDDPVALLETLTRFRIKKFRLSIDDFGTGYSSMLHLVRLPFTEIKIDKDFVGIADSSEEARSVIRCIIDLSKSLGMDTVAEGVETQQTRDFLTQCGCTSFQGYLISKPLGQEKMSEWLRQYCAQARVSRS